MSDLSASRRKKARRNVLVVATLLATLTLAFAAGPSRVFLPLLTGVEQQATPRPTTSATPRPVISAGATPGSTTQPLPNATATPLATRQPTPLPTAGSSQPTLGGCSMFPADNPWNRDISAAPLHPRSAAFVASINAGGSGFLHPDWSSNPDTGIPFVVVPAAQAPVPVTFRYADESDPGPYPVPADAPIEAGSDRHVLVLRQSECKLYELFAAGYVGPGWTAGSGAIFDLRSNALRPDGWTSADAAGLPILPGLVRYDEVQAGAIRHALRFTARQTQRGYIHPATHQAGHGDDPDLPPMGLRLRLRADYDLTGYSGAARVVLEALKRYGMIVADNGGSWFITGSGDPRWDDENLEQLKRVPGSAFEAVYTGEVITP